MSSELEEDVPQGKINWALWRRLAVFMRPYKWHAAGLIAVAMLLAICDVRLPMLSGRLVDAAVADGATAALARFAIPYAVTFAAIAACVFVFILICGRIACGVSADIRTAAFDKLQQLQFAYFDKRAVGWMMARLTSDCNTLSRVAAWGLLDITWGVTVLVAMVIAMFQINVRLAVAVCLIAPLLFGVTWFFQRKLLGVNRKIKKTNSQLTAAFNESIQGVRTTKSLVREAENLREFAAQTDTMYVESIRSATMSAVFIPLVACICSVGVGLALWAGGVQVVAGTITIGVLVTFLNYAGNIQGPAQELANTLSMIQSAQASAERILGLLDEPVTIKDDPAASAPTSDDIRRIEFRDITFGYDPKSPVLHEFNLTVDAGQTIALVGATGGGKSTIVSLVCRFYEPTSGQILFDGVDYRTLPIDWLHGSLGMVLQQPHLFSGTIRENIRYGRLDATDADVESAARLTNAHEFIAGLPGAYDAAVGEGGNQLSTGQKQLIALARAVIADPKIFVMDEATSSVDTQTERDIQTAVERVLAGRIAFVIAHRLSTIKNADQILVIDAGRVIEQGTHHDLINRKGRYYELYTNQFTQEHEDELMRGSSPA
jgi:ATP-binding cassette, subfamily B, bacterial